MERYKVIDAIDGEREYQEDEAGKEDSHVVLDISIGDTLAAIQYNLNLALSAWYNNRAPHEVTMGYARKIGALCVQAGEKYGMPNREGY